MQLFKSKNWLKLLALILVFGLVICCFAACADNSGSNDDDEDDEASDKKDKDDDDDPRDGLVKYTFSGLNIYLGKDFDEGVSASGDQAMFHTDEISVLVECVDVDFESSEEFAEDYKDEHEDSYASIKIKEANGVSYAVCDIGDDTYEVCGFYIDGSNGWIVHVTAVDYDDLSKTMIKYATLCKIDDSSDEDEDDDSSDEENSDRDEEDDDDDPIEPPTTATEAPTDPPVDQTYITVHAYVPDSWASPGCWAWNSITGEDVFSAWPGEAMDKGRDWYTIDIPSWINYVIINANDGSIQTEDIAVDSGYDIWIIIHASEPYYTLYYSEPGSDELANHGY